MISWTIQEEHAGLSIRSYLQTVHKFSRRLLTSIINEGGCIEVNGKQKNVKYLLRAGDELKLTFPPEKKNKYMTPENIPLDIIYEDNDLLVINKPKGMVVHPTNTHQKSTLVHALLNYTTSLSRIGGEERPGIVHRLDKDTSGLLVVAKNDDVHKHLVQQFSEQTILRTYEAIVHGTIQHHQGKIDAPIGRDPNNRLRMTVIEGGKNAITHFKLIQQMNEYSHIECRLETGRTHQIRVHLSYIGHPLMGDEKYTHMPTPNISGQALFAKSLGFIHPTSHKWMDFEIDQPEYFKQLIKQL